MHINTLFPRNYPKELFRGCDVNRVLSLSAKSVVLRVYVSWVLCVCCLDLCVLLFFFLDRGLPTCPHSRRCECLTINVFPPAFFENSLLFIYFGVTSFMSLAAPIPAVTKERMNEERKRRYEKVLKMFRKEVKNWLKENT